MLYRIVRFICAPIFKLIFGVEVRGKENIPQNGGYIICPNHISIADVLVLAVAFKCHIRYMGKEELFKNPVLGVLLKALGCFAVKRGKGDMGAINSACDILNKGGIFGIFPEGTRSKTGKPTKGKTGVAMISMKTKAPLLPVGIRYENNKPKLFGKTYVNIGKLIEYKEPDEGVSLRTELRDITENLMNNIVNLWEMKA